ncbi:hypothetical protein GCM10023196_074030 [Actinoallomurus vinaceus]|uniref:CU044_5270 family protein n=1 Tax=Actinoallomurus vinaceus TaxID=1080074 RepID=A0ABP8UMG6_9ACTN
MDDQRMIRSFLAEAPPSAEVIAEGRRRVLAQAKPRPRPRGTTFRLGLGGLGVATAAAATAVALTVSGGSPASRTMPTTQLTAQQVLLAAAQKAASEPVGRYWHSHVIDGQAYHVAKGDYVITGARHEIDQWIARTDGDDDVFRSRFAGAIPQTSADRAAWQRAGSPSTWRVLSNGQYIAQTATPDKWDLVRTTPAQRKGYEKMLARARKECAAKPRICPAAQQITQAQREALPKDPSALRAYLLSPGGKGGPSAALTNAAHFLAKPGSPKLRAAVFRTLAGMQGIRNKGRTTDVRGRTATALAARSSDARGTFDVELLLRPGTYQVLGTETVLVSGRGAETQGMKPGTVFTQELFLEMGWANTAPR